MLQMISQDKHRQVLASARDPFAWSQPAWRSRPVRVVPRDGLTSAAL
jgi:hypothetical protein